MSSIHKEVRETRSGRTTTIWRVSYKDDQQQWRNKRFGKRADADAFRRRIERQIDDGTYVAAGESATVADACRTWLAACEAGRDGREPVEPHTLRVYDQHVRNYIAPALEDIPLNRLTRGRVVEFRDSLASLGISRATAKKVLGSLRMALDEAVSRELVGVNVAGKLKITTAGRHQAAGIIIPSKAEVSALLTAAAERAKAPHRGSARAWRRYHALLQVAVFGGLRLSEIRGLPRDALDSKAGTLEVRQRASETGDIGPPKSKAGYRTVHLPARAMTALRALLLERPGPLAFGTRSGRPDSHANILQRFWYPLQLACGLVEPRSDPPRPRHDFHTLRHFHASHLIAGGANAKEIMAELGHSSIQVSFDLYGHLFPDTDQLVRRRARADSLADEL